MNDPLARQGAIEDKAGKHGGGGKSGAPKRSRPHKPDLDEMTVGRTEKPVGRSSGGKPGSRTFKTNRR